MKIVFVGPTVPQAARFTTLSVRPPAQQGDVVRAVEEGATVICLIDGIYEYVPATWHKEILFALSRGVIVIGAASMGSLRAVECAFFGMVGIGAIFQAYQSGIRIDDADVALLHGPQELGYPSLTLPMVNVDATLEALLWENQISKNEFDTLVTSARRLFFKLRTWRSVCQSAGYDPESWVPRLTAALVDQKRIDALAAIRFAESCAAIDHPNWNLNITPLWRTMYSVE